MKIKHTFLMVFLFTISMSIAQTITTETLLKEMVDRDKIARYPSQDFRLKQHSSYDRKSVSPEEAKGWFANSDFNNQSSSKNFIRVEMNAQGEKEWVMMDHQGAGALVRVWMPNKGLSETTLRFYFDGEEKPSIETNLYTFFNGEGEVPYPFAHKSLLSIVSFFPMAYAKSCKITASKKPYFFQYTFREYTKGTAIKTFELADLKKQACQRNRRGVAPPSKCNQRR